jgi:hypothetical protein
LRREDVAAAIGCSKRTLFRRLADDEEFAAAMAEGQAKLAVEMSNIVLTAAKKGDVAAAQWLLERRIPGWRKNADVEVTINQPPTLNIFLTTEKQPELLHEAKDVQAEILD